MTIRSPALKELKEVKILVDQTPEMDTDGDTFSLAYFRRLRKDGILLIAKTGTRMQGVVFGTFSGKEQWADLIGIVVHSSHRQKGVGRALLQAFEREVKNHRARTIDLYSDPRQVVFFTKHGFKKGRSYVAMRMSLS